MQVFREMAANRTHERNHHGEAGSVSVDLRIGDGYRSVVLGDVIDHSRRDCTSAKWLVYSGWVEAVRPDLTHGSLNAISASLI